MRANHDKVYGAVVLALALLLAPASALGQVINRNFTITDSTDSDTTAVVNHSGASNSGVAQTICRNGSNTVTISGTTTHPDSVRLVKNTTRMGQTGLGNPVTARVIGAGGLVFNVVLACITSELETFVNNASNVSAGKFQLQLETCTGLTDPRITYLNDTCLADAANTNIKFTIDGTTLEKLRIKGAGTAL